MIFSLAVCIIGYGALAFALLFALIGTAGVAADAIGILPSFLAPAAYGFALVGLVGANIIASIL